MASNLEVGKAAPPAAAKGLRAKVVERARTARSAQDSVVERAPGTGNGPQPGLVILVSFANQGSVGTTEDQWSQDFFGAGSSVAAYYQANSFGKFALVPAAESAGVANNGVVGWLQLPYDHPNFGNDFGPSETKLGVDAVTAADPYVDYKSFDTNNDGALSVSELHVTVIVAGYETSYGGELDVCGNSVWGHQGGLYDSAPKLDGTTVSRGGGTMFGEWMCQGSTPPGQKSTIGIMVHEMGHDIGFPDLYDTDLSSAGVGRWSAMSTGSWNRVDPAFSGTTPAGLDAFSKSYQGWVAPASIVGAVNGAPLPSAATSPTSYRLGANPDDVDWKFEVSKGAGEYFLVENRQLVGWDAALPACGVIVYHVDESVTFTNQANADEAHRLVDVVEADGTLALNTYGYGGSAADLFPGSSGHVDFTDATLPPATLYSGAPSGAAMHVNGGCADPMSANLLHPAAQRLVRDGDSTHRHQRLGHRRQQWRHQGGRRTGRRGQSRRRVGLVLVQGPGHRQAAPLDRGVVLQHPAGRLPRLVGGGAARNREQRRRGPDARLEPPQGVGQARGHLRDRDRRPEPGRRRGSGADVAELPLRAHQRQVRQGDQAVREEGQEGQLQRGRRARAQGTQEDRGQEGRPEHLVRLPGQARGPAHDRPVRVAVQHRARGLHRREAEEAAQGRGRRQRRQGQEQPGVVPGRQGHQVPDRGGRREAGGREAQSSAGTETFARSAATSRRLSGAARLTRGSAARPAGKRGATS